jgi:ATP-binding cassette subfamily F protein uup
LPNVVNAERVSVQYGTRLVLNEVSLGVSTGDVVGVVGRNGSGKTTLLRILTGVDDPDSGRVIRAGTASIGYLHQADDFAAEATVRDVIVAGEADHVWAADPWTRAVVEHLLGAVDLDAEVSRLSGGERRRTALVALMLGGHDLLVLDEPTNHLDVEAVDWLAQHLRTLQDRGTAMLVVSHDRWFLDAVCSRVWEVHDGVVDAYDGGYAAYVLARAERARQNAQLAARRKNLLRKELAWLRRGAPARTSKPKFRIDAASTLIADEPPPRDSLELERFAVTRLGKDVFDLTNVTAVVGDRVLIEDLSWSIGPGARIGLIGVNGAGKTTLLRLLTGERQPEAGRVKRGRTVDIGHLSQAVGELPAVERVLDLVTAERRVTQMASGREVTVTSLLEDFGFTGERLTTRIGDLSGGEQRRLQLLRLLIGEPNVLLLDEPTNDLDIDTLTVVEDYLDSWPGTLIVVTHDRYFLERVCDVTYALLGDGRCVLLPGGVDQYLALRHAAERDTDVTASRGARAEAAAGPVADGLSVSGARQARKDLARIESQLGKVERRIERLHEQMVQAASDYGRLAELQHQLTAATDEQATLEEAWLTTADALG